MFAEARKSGMDLKALGQQLAARKRKLSKDPSIAVKTRAELADGSELFATI